MFPSPSGVIFFSYAKWFNQERKEIMLPSPSGVLSFSSCLCNASIHAVSFATLRLKNSTTLFLKLFFFSRKMSFCAEPFTTYLLWQCFRMMLLLFVAAIILATISAASPSLRITNIICYNRSLKTK